MEGVATRVKILRCEIADGSGEAGAVLDDRLTIACGKALCAFSNCSAPASSR